MHIPSVRGCDRGGAVLRTAAVVCACGAALPIEHHTQDGAGA
jgi:hypothetical protein